MSAGNGVGELKLVENQLVNENRCFDTYKRNWVGSPLELVLTFLLSFYERQPETDSHALLSNNLKQIGCATMESRSNGLVFQVIFIEARAPK